MVIFSWSFTHIFDDYRDVVLFANFAGINLKFLFNEDKVAS